MSTAGLFVMGTIVTLIVAAAMGVLVWGAIQDSRDRRQREAEHPVPPADLSTGQRAA